MLVDVQGWKEGRRREQHRAEGTEKQHDRESRLEEEHARNVSTP